MKKINKKGVMPIIIFIIIAVIIILVSIILGLDWGNWSDVENIRYDTEEDKCLQEKITCFGIRYHVIFGTDVFCILNKKTITENFDETPTVIIMGLDKEISIQCNQYFFSPDNKGFCESLDGTWIPANDRFGDKCKVVD